MEVYRNTDAAVFIELPTSVITSSTSIEARAYDNGVLLHEFNEVIATTGPSGLNAPLPWELTREDRDFFVDWEVLYTTGGVAKEFKERHLVQVVTPILPLAEITRISTWTDELEVRDLEHRVRYAIQSYTGQNFGKYRATMAVPGTGASSLALPAPLLAVSSTEFEYSGLTLANGGLILQSGGSGWLGVKDAPADRYLDKFYYTNGPIQVSETRGSVFSASKEYSISGLWGYHDVPADVKQAARMLVTDYSCDESLWRDRYIESVRSGNWRFEVNDQAFTGTGNVAVDQILEKYRQLTLAVV